MRRVAVLSWCMISIVWSSAASGSTDGCISERGRGLDPSGYDVVVAGVIVGNTPDSEDLVPPEAEADPWSPQSRPVVAVILRPVAAWKGVPIGTRELELSVPASRSYPGFEIGTFRLLLADNPPAGAHVRRLEVKAYCSHLHSVTDLFSHQLPGLEWINTPEWSLAPGEAADPVAHSEEGSRDPDSAPAPLARREETGMIRAEVENALSVVGFAAAASLDNPRSLRPHGAGGALPPAGVWGVRGLRPTGEAAGAVRLLAERPAARPIEERDRFK